MRPAFDPAVEELADTRCLDLGPFDQVAVADVEDLDVPLAGEPRRAVFRGAW